MFLALIVLGAAGVWAQTNNTIDLSTVTSDITVNNGYTLTGTLGANVQISIANGATVTLNNVTINGVDNSSYNWAGITCNGNATIILVGENTVKGFYSYRSGIYVPENSTLTIQGSGSLTASSNGNGVGIGGNKSGSGGNIIIAGGTITATGGNECAGIGGGQGGSCGNISITSGIVIATGGNSASGIGGGQGGSCGNISITGGTVTATGGNSAPGIGGGGSSCNINISGGMVTATGGNSAPGIGGKQSGGCGTITIANTVTGIRAVKGGGSAQASYSIGAGQGGSCGTVTVNGNVSNGITTNPYSYPSYILDDIPTGWSVRADNNNVTVTDGVASIPVGATVVLTPPTPDKPRVKDVELLTPEEIPLTFEAIVDNATVTFTKASTLPDLSIEYSKNGEEWTAYSEPITLNIGEKVSFRGDNTTYATSYNNDSYSRFSCTNQCYVYGNIMSLINSDTNDYATNKTLEGAYAFCKLFFSNNNIYSHASKELILPATTLSAYCYDNMFYQCSNLTNAPVLPATTLTDHCYFGMFMYCHGITTAPELPAKTLAPSCYYQMFAFTNIIATPELPAKTLATSCYKNMFQGCTYLTTATALPATTLASNCYSYMFIGCSNLTTAPELPATMLENNCYNNMFKNCTHLNKVTCLATDISATGCTTDWLDGVAGTGTFIKPSSMTSWLIDNPSGIPYGWTPTDVMLVTPLTFEAKKANATVTFTAATTINNLSIEYSTDGTTWKTYDEPVTLTSVGDKVSFRGNNATYATDALYYYHDRYSNFSCSADCYIYGNIMSLVNKDNFANTTILTNGYTFCLLFYNNNKIYNHGSKPLSLPATTLAPSCYRGMFWGCTQLTTAPVLPAMSLAEICYAGMFRDCTKLETIPELPATTLAEYCYAGMFQGCTSLTTAPALPATTLATSCYSSMFQECTSLTTAPVLPATTLVSNCYKSMFENCTNLNSVTCLATDISASYCTNYWLAYVAATGTFNKASEIAVGEGGWALNSVSGIPQGWTVDDYYDPLATPLTFEAMTAGAVVRFTKGSYVTWTNTVEYSLNGGAWTTYASGTGITLTNVGDKVSFRGNNAKYAISMSDNGTEHSNFSCTKNCSVYGNIMSLIDADDYPTMTVLTSDNSFAFCNLFTGNDKIYNHPSKTLVLPATTLAYRCYGRMFYNCSNLTSAPALLATTLAEDCCYQMFYGCSSLTSAPALPATTLAQSCYYNMFYYCSSLTSAPALPATTLAHSCYAYMFQGCSNLTSAPALPATTLAQSCYQGMFQSCSNLTSAPALPATTLASSCYRQMFQNCTSLSSAPALPATTLASSCYSSMFYGCSNLNSVTCLATDISASNCTSNWLSGVAATGTFNKAASMTTWPTGPYNSNNVNGIPVGWTVVNEGALPGEFTVNANGGKVNFSMGNLQASTSDLGTNWKWSFANHQYVFIGNNAANNSIIGNGTVSTNGTVDLFGWSTAATEYGIHNSKSSAYTGDFVDWGSRIGTGWRTLTGNDNGEWRWLLGNSPAGNNVPGTNCRTSSTVNGVANARFSHIKVDGVCGLIIFPDIYTHPDGVTPIANINQYYVSWTNITTNYSTSDWAKMEKAGAVFLPMAGQREGNTVKFYYNYDNSNKGSAFYWSSTLAGDGSAYGIGFGSTTNEWNLSTNSSSMRYMGRSVRLVKNITGSGSLSYATTEVNKTTADAAFTNPLTMVGDGTVTYAKSDDNNNICTVNANTGEVTLNGNTGSCTITATVANSPFFNYATNTASYTLTVTPATPLQIPLTIEAKIAPATVTFTKGSNVTWTNPVEYSLNGGAWTEYASGTGITLTNVGDKVSFRGNNVSYATSTSEGYYSKFAFTSPCYVYGNIMSLIDASSFATNITLEGGYNNFCRLFYNNSNLYNHPSKTLVLPATNISSSPNIDTYCEMFRGCTHLTTAPELPATILPNSCYNGMFYGCTSLTIAPELPATEFGAYCYKEMFYGCTGLTTAPELPATTLSVHCYEKMFYGCTSLTTAPTLPAPTLTMSCYEDMFHGCTHLNSVTCFATSEINSSNNSTSNWLYNVASSGTFTKNASTPTGSGTSGQYWPTGDASGIPSGWTVTEQ